MPCLACRLTLSGPTDPIDQGAAVPVIVEAEVDAVTDALTITEGPDLLNTRAECVRRSMAILEFTTCPIVHTKTYTKQ